MENGKPKVAIAGAGPVGLALALGLARMGVRSVVLEKAATLPPYSRALVVLTRTLEAFAGWNVIDRFAEESEFITNFCAYRAETNEPFICLDFTALRDATPQPAIAVLPQDQTEKILCDELLKTGLSEVLFQNEVVGAAQDARGVALTVERNVGERYDLHADYLVGCDGAHSAVRESLGIPLEGTTYPVHVFLADVSITDSRDELPWPRLAFDVPRFLFAVRFEPGHWRLVGALDAANADAPLDDAFYKTQVEATIGPGPFELLWQSKFNIHRRHADAFRDGRILLAGDAGHLNSPAGGQGMNAGIQDAHNLAWKLAYTLRGGDADVLLDSYDIERHEAITQGVEVFTDRLSRFGLFMSRNVRATLTRAARALIAVPLFRRRVLLTMMMLSAHYRRSPLFFGRSSLIGRRSPEITALAAYRPTLVLYEPSDEVTAAAPGCNVPDLRVTETSDWRAWKCRQPFAALVRPDGIVGYFERQPTAESLRHNVRAALGLAS